MKIVLLKGEVCPFEMALWLEIPANFVISGTYLLILALARRNPKMILLNFINFYHSVVREALLCREEHRLSIDV
jgi:hypothetical protein